MSQLSNWFLQLGTNIQIQSAGANFGIAGQYSTWNFDGSFTLTATGPNSFTISGGFSNPMTGVGDMIIGGSAGAPTRLPAGTNGQVLEMVGGVPAWSSGGSSIPTIAASMTVNVPADYATIGAAIAYAESAVFLNGAVLTINYTNSTCSEQVFVTDVDLPIQFTTSGPVTVTPSGWVASPASFDCMFNFQDCSIINLGGTWNLSAGPYALSYTNNSVVRKNASSSGWYITDIITPGDGFLNITGGTMSSGPGCLYCIGGEVIIAGASLTSTTGDAITTTGYGTNIKVTGSTLTSASAPINMLAGAGGQVVSQGNTLSLSGSGGVFYNTNGPGIICASGDTIATSGTHQLAATAGGTIQVHGLTTSGISTGARFSVASGGVIQANGGGAATWGADNQTALVPTTAGLILSN